MSVRIRLIVCALALVCAIAMTASAVDQPIRVGVSVSLTGSYAPFGRMGADGLRLWAKKWNAKGGILGRPIDLVIHDDEGNPEKAAEIYREMLSSGRFDLVFGPYSSPISAAVVPLLEEYRYPTLMPMTTVESIWDAGPRYIFGVMTPERRWTKGLFTLMAGARINRMVVLVDEALLKLGSPREARKWAGRLGLEILFLNVLDKKNLPGQLRLAREANAQALIVWGYFDDAVAVRRALAEMGWTPKMFFSQVAPAGEEYGKVLGDLANYTLGCGIWDSEIGRLFPGGIEFAEWFRQEYKYEPGHHAAYGYAAGEILAEAISRAGSTDREKVREMLSKLDTVTLIGRYGVDEKGVQIRQRPLIIQWQNGRRHVIWPEPLRTAPLQFPPSTGEP